MELPYEKQFHFGDGSAIASLDQLKDRIENLSYQEFYHHVNAERNDFASWIRHVLKDENLANDLEKVSSIVETVEILNDYLNPRPVPSQEDLQSQIEKQQDINPPEVQEVPSTTPEEAQVSDEGADLKIIEEAVEAELSEQEPQNEDQEETPEVPAEETHEAEPEEEKSPTEEKFVLSAHEKKMLVVKDFIFGMLFGLVIGIILGRVITLG